MQKTYDRLGAATPEENTDMLGVLARYLGDLPIGEAADAILVELENGRDAETGLDFVPGDDGLDSAPTWRVYLLDLLGQIDPRSAAAYARESIFPLTDSADEWAVAMRNAWQSYPRHGTELSRKEMDELLGRMLARSDWRAAPTAGMMEALDFVAHAARPAVHLLAVAQWMEERPDLPTAQAVQIVLERVSLQRADDILPALAPTARTGGEAGTAIRAMAMARADLRRPAQRKAVADYLLRLPPGSLEARAFFGAFPLHTFSVATGLRGQPKLPHTRDLRAADEKAVEVLGQWSRDPAMAGHVSSIATLLAKLREWTENR